MLPTAFLARIQTRAFEPIDIASLVFFRIAFGLLMVCEVARYFGHGWIARYWIEPKFLFSYLGFGWVHPWPGAGMYLHFTALGLLALFLALGLFYRISAVLFFVGITYCFLLEQANYLNHFYLICLFSFLLIFVPANRALSIDALLNPKIRSNTVPAWAIWLFRGQMALVYFYSGVAKISWDWVSGRQLQPALIERMNLPIIGRFFQQEWAVYVINWGGLLLDLLAAPLLLWPRTRIFAFCCLLIFHLMNARLFDIGIFPWLAVATTTVFLSPGWPRRVLAIFSRRATVPESASATFVPPEKRARVSVLIAVYFTIQFLLPLRHWLYPGNVAWTYEGHLFSWRMKLIDRDGNARFFVTDPNIGITREVDPLTYLNPRQAWKMAARPEMILEFAHFLARTEPRAGPKPLQVRAEVMLALNARPPALLIDPNIDLAAERRRFGHKEWIMPMPD